MRWYFHFFRKGLLRNFCSYSWEVVSLVAANGCFWKYPNIVPIFISGNSSDVCDYRPISLFNAFLRVFDKVMYNRLYNYFKRKIVSIQHGFLARRSVETNLRTFLNCSMPTVQSRSQVDAVFLDVCKAFDKVNHALLLI